MVAFGIAFARWQARSVWLSLPFCWFCVQLFLKYLDCANCSVPGSDQGGDFRLPRSPARRLDPPCGMALVASDLAVGTENKPLLRGRGWNTI
jgi:hypothetical protein